MRILAIRVRQSCHAGGDFRVGMAAAKIVDQVVEQTGQIEMAERPWPELLEQRAVHQLQPLGDRQDLGHAARNLGGAVIRDLGGRGLDRGGIGDDAEQAGAGLVVQLGGDLAPLLLLHRDQLADRAAGFPRASRQARRRAY